MVQTAIQRLAELLESDDSRVVVAAATAILDRAGVTPMEVHAHLGSRNPLDDLVSSDETPEIEPAEMERLACEKAVVQAGATGGEALTPRPGADGG